MTLVAAHARRRPYVSLFLLEARKYALERRTSINQLVREYLAGLVKQQDRRRAARARLKAALAKGIVVVGPRTWTREDLYERQRTRGRARVR